MLYDTIKRLIDIVVAIAVFLIFSPLIVLIAVAIKVDSPGPIIYKQKRVGLNGHLIDLYKFRSMMEGADDFLLRNTAFRKKFKRPEGWKTEASEDPRITRVGRFIRKYTLDELPQLWNVMTGDMSIIGPRAYRQDDKIGDEIEQQLKFYPHLRDKIKVALSVKPGITGPWQVGGRNKLSWDKRVELDADYAKRRSLPYDLLILLKTPFAMLNKW
ncbi:MAG: Exopolysaccharide biosynthesis polyprenyl glycosylphosphotransferase [Microgenomates group bacterium GW2011_GWA1_48_10]|uniref:Bacterial sugar transferase domain-containing protein n=1 Tax=Candidatus Gottesmanbacteria bacterium RIFCSPHIGHO2_01_FULL_47_48 TaxID=1798381 RepID=A0A1F6A367_9BACT|nr:MAG: Exopolysaccharide biosynthesis polyprenyl glycosylphosphotransferase [Microgenomates group bacterium GW2011_GWA1_48_10]OGG19148.1 MAG: hypothetical protein A2721_01885 [Candidatus Gottesmanbacteria bacterium RIFCSPHIGHO2_01_FULL_47_48]